MRPLKWGTCCGYATDTVVEYEGRLYQAIRRVFKGERPTASDAWLLIRLEGTRADMARQIDPRIGVGV